jgi:hypothetical protein
MDPLAGTAAPRVETLRRPRFHVIQPMIGLGEARGQPPHGDPAEAQAHPVAMGGTGLVSQGWHPQAVTRCHQERPVIDACTAKG